MSFEVSANVGLEGVKLGIITTEWAKHVAVCINVATALYLALQVGSKETTYASGNLKTTEIEKAMQELLHVRPIDQCRVYPTDHHRFSLYIPIHVSEI